MDQYERQEKKREAMRRLRQQRHHAGVLRRRVVATSLVAFVLLWAVVFAQMATGHDPVLGDGSKTLTASAASRSGTRAAKRVHAARVKAGARTDAEALFEEPVEEVEQEAFEEPEPVVTSQS